MKSNVKIMKKIMAWAALLVLFLLLLGIIYAMITGNGNLALALITGLIFITVVFYTVIFTTRHIENRFKKEKQDI